MPFKSKSLKLILFKEFEEDADESQVIQTVDPESRYDNPVVDVDQGGELLLLKVGELRVCPSSPSQFLDFLRLKC